MVYSNDLMINLPVRMEEKAYATIVVAITT